MKINNAQLACLRQAAKQPDGTVLCIGHNRHDPTGPTKSHAMATAMALERRGLLAHFKGTAWGYVYKLTLAGYKFLETAPCCANEKRSMAGGCTNCGDPSL